MIGLRLAQPQQAADGQPQLIRVTPAAILSMALQRDASAPDPKGVLRRLRSKSAMYCA